MKMKQLELNSDELLKIGFEKKIFNEPNPYNSNLKERVTYEIPCINGCFYYNENEPEYRWYHKTIIGDASNHIQLNIEKREELFLLLLCFRVNFNYKSLM